MSLSKFFNFNYLIQNIKKSKMTIALFFIIVPVFTSLVLISMDDDIVDFSSLGVINILGMYFVPFIFSMSLFGYVFKKKSVDFIGSMPISRKCIFITNTIGGIILILLLQLITLLSTLLISISKGTIIMGMAWDLFVFQTVAYIFVFVVSNLAMCLSGNVSTQVAVTMLIVFLVPFSIWYINVISSTSSYGIEYNLMNGNSKIMELSKVGNYTAPSLIANNGEYEYNVVSLWKMSILSVVYFVIGLIAFQKRKMEMAEESFNNKYVHFIVKGLTLVPFVALLMQVDDFSDLTVSLIIVAIIVIYYLVFDLITSKKLKLWENAVALLISIIFIWGAYSFLGYVNERIEKHININNIKTADFCLNDCFYTRVSDKEKIKQLLISASKNEKNYNYSDASYLMKISLTSYGGSKYIESFYLNPKAIQEILSDEYMIESIGENAKISDYSIKLTQEEKMKILSIVNNTKDETSLEDVLKARDNKWNLNVGMYDYKNHELIKIYYPAILNKDIQNILLSAYNRFAIKCLDEGEEYYSYINVNQFELFDYETNQKIWFVTERCDNKELIDFIYKYADDVPNDITKCIEIGTYKYRFFTDHVDEFLKLINDICERNKEEFKEYIRIYDQDVYFKGIE